MKPQLTLKETCCRCNEHYQLEVYQEDYNAWRHDGVLIQNAMPYIPVDARELLITGMCGVCVSELFE